VPNLAPFIVKRLRKFRLAIESKQRGC
jgi:hypothetical protein